MALDRNSHLHEAGRLVISDPSQAIVHANLAIADGAVLGYFYRGRAGVQLEEYSDGLEDLTTAIDLMATDPTTDDVAFAEVLFHAALAESYFVGIEAALPNLDRAIVVLDKVVPSSALEAIADQVTIWQAHVYELKCHLLTKLRRYDEAAETATAMIDRCNLLEGYFLRAAAFDSMDARASALSDVNAYIQGTPDSAEAFRLKATILLGESQWEEALEAARTAVQLDSSDMHSRGLLCQACTHLRRYSEAAEEAREALSHDAELAWPHIMLGIDAFHRDAWEEASREWEEAVRMDPSGNAGSDARAYLEAIGNNLNQGILQNVPTADDDGRTEGHTTVAEPALGEMVLELLSSACRLDHLADDLGHGPIFVGLNMLFERSPRLAAPCHSEETFTVFINTLNELLQKCPEGRLETHLPDQKAKDLLASISAFRNRLEHIRGTKPAWAEEKHEKWEAKKKRWSDLTRDLCRQLAGKPVLTRPDQWALAQNRLLGLAVDLLKTTHQRMADHAS